MDRLMIAASCLKSLGATIGDLILHDARHETAYLHTIWVKYLTNPLVSINLPILLSYCTRASYLHVYGLPLHHSVFHIYKIPLVASWWSHPAFSCYVSCCWEKKKWSFCFPIAGRPFINNKLLRVAFCTHKHFFRFPPPLPQSGCWKFNAAWQYGAWNWAEQQQYCCQAVL